MPTPLLLLALLGTGRLAAAQLGAPLPGTNATGLPTQGLVTVITTVPSFRTFIPSPTVVVYGGRTWTVAAAPATLTISDGCPCAITTTRCLGPECYYKGPDELPDYKPLGSGDVLIGAATATGARVTGAARVGGGGGGGDGGKGGEAAGGGGGGQKKGAVAGEGEKALSSAARAAGEVIFGVVAAVVLGGVLMVL